MENEGFHRKLTTNLQCIENGGKDLDTTYDRTILKYNYQSEFMYNLSIHTYKIKFLSKSNF